MAKPYTCALCAKGTSRCRDCRLRRAAADVARRERKRAEGTCCVCARPALPDQSRCQLHQADNTQRSGEAHKQRRIDAARD